MKPLKENQNKITALPDKLKLRNRRIVRTSILGIISNVILAAIKVFTGLSVNSMAMILDAINNLSDSMSSVLTIIGTVLASRKPNKQHPLGFGRVEYISSMIISMLVCYAGIVSFVKSGSSWCWIMRLRTDRRSMKRFILMYRRYSQNTQSLL